MNDKFGYIKTGLKDLPEKDPPYDITGAVMANISPHRVQTKRKFYFDFKNILFDLYHNRFATIAAGTICTLLAFFGGYALHAVMPHHKVPKIAGTADANFQIGKEYYFAGMGQEALHFFTEASKQSPENPVYPFWRGLVYWSEGEIAKERESYRQSIINSNNYLPALLNLANSYLNQGDFNQALPLYNRVIELEPQEEQALYNRALSYRLAGYEKQEQAALKKFLELHRTGKRAEKAVQRLHTLGNREFRSYPIGGQQVILNQSVLLGETGSPVLDEIQIVTKALHEPVPVKIHVVVFSPGNLELGREKARSLQESLNLIIPTNMKHSVTSSWFDRPESQTGNRPDKIDESLLLFTTPTTYL